MHKFYFVRISRDDANKNAKQQLWIADNARDWLQTNWICEASKKSWKKIQYS